VLVALNIIHCQHNTPCCYGYSVQTIDTYNNNEQDALWPISVYVLRCRMKPICRHEQMAVETERLDWFTDTEIESLHCNLFPISTHLARSSWTLLQYLPVRNSTQRMKYTFVPNSLTFCANRLSESWEKLAEEKANRRKSIIYGVRHKFWKTAFYAKQQYLNERFN